MNIDLFISVCSVCSRFPTAPTRLLEGWVGVPFIWRLIRDLRNPGSSSASRPNAVRGRGSIDDRKRDCNPPKVLLLQTVKHLSLRQIFIEHTAGTVYGLVLERDSKNPFDA